MMHDGVKNSQDTAVEDDQGTTGIGNAWVVFQHARAFGGFEGSDDPELRQRLAAKVERWSAVWQGLQNGTVQPGFRQPVQGMPLWATLEVMKGGFATGEVLSGGPLKPHEPVMMAQAGVSPADPRAARLDLNTWFLGEAGLQQLGMWLESGCYEVDVPEEAALLSIAWLLKNNDHEAAARLVDEILPWFATMRFYPRAVGVVVQSGTWVCVETVADTEKRLRRVKEPGQIARQRESVTVWTPLYDELVALFLETVEGDAPVALRTESGSWLTTATGSVAIEGGWPCTTEPEGWSVRARDLLEKYTKLRNDHGACVRPASNKTSLGQLLALLASWLDNPAGLGAREVGRVRLIVARYVAKHGLPGSEVCRLQRQREWEHASRPAHSQFARQMVERLKAFAREDGLQSLEPLAMGITQKESIRSHIASGTPIPQAVLRRLDRCLLAPVDVLVKRKIISSPEMLALLLPKLVSAVRAEAFASPALRALYAATYRAFRFRRSLLLLDLQNQVQLHELPWVKALDPYKRSDPGGAESARLALRETALLALQHFAHAMVPNKLVTELQALSNAAGVAIPFTQEVAADIFMGRFSEKYADAAWQAWEFLQDSLYARYYKISDAPFARLPPEATISAAMALQFSERCCARVGTKPKAFSVAYNGAIIEQQQILTTHNLVALVTHLQLADDLQPRAVELAMQCLHKAAQRLQTKTSDWRTRLTHNKHAAYAWRQMVFFLSMGQPSQVNEFFTLAGEQLARHPGPWQDKMRGYLQDLQHCHTANPAEPLTHDIWLGWVVGKRA